MSRTAALTSLAAVLALLGAPAPAADLPLVPVPALRPESPAAADLPLAPERRVERWTLAVDNDAFLNPHSDKDYTGGIAFSLSGTRARDGWLSLDPLLAAAEDAVDLEGFAALSGEVFHATQGGLLAFTPADAGRSDIVEGDRPYASLVYLANSRAHFHRDARRITQSSFAVGVLGLRVAAAAERTIHGALDVEPAQGWRHQIADGGEPTLRLRVSSRTLLGALATDSGLRYEMQGSWSASVGYISEVTAALSARWGFVRTSWWTFAPEVGDYLIDAVPAGPRRHAAREAYLVAGAMGHVQAYNALLQGQFRHSDLTYDYGQIRPLGVNAWVGVQAQVAGAYSLLLLARYQSPELRVAPGNRELVWGSLSVIREF